MNIQAGSCRLQAEWIATPRVPHKDSSSSTAERQKYPEARSDFNREKDQKDIKCWKGLGPALKDQSPTESAYCVSGCGYVVRRNTEMVVVPEFELRSGGCWVILSFTHVLVRVSRSGGTVSMSDKHIKANNQLTENNKTSHYTKVLSKRSRLRS